MWKVPLLLLLTCVCTHASKIPAAEGDQVEEVVSLIEDVDSEKAEKAQTEEREDRQSIFAAFARVAPVKCTSGGGIEGVCKKMTDCEEEGGEVDGSCSQAFSVCCVYAPPVCGSQLKTATGYLESAGYPSSAPEGTCTYSVAKHATDVVQLKIEFLDLELSGPTNGECLNDTLQIADVDYPNLMRKPVCGSLTDSDPFYLSVEGMSVDTKIIFNVEEDSDARWKIKVTQLKKEDAAPPLCLKYFTEPEGVIKSFNHQAGFGEWLGNMNYATCFKKQPGFCDISFTANHFDIGDGKLCFGTECITGNEFPASLMYNCTNGPYVFPYMSGATNDDQGAGYELTYLFQPA